MRIKEVLPEKPMDRAIEGKMEVFEGCGLNEKP